MQNAGYQSQHLPFCIIHGTFWELKCNTTYILLSSAGNGENEAAGAPCREYLKAYYLQLAVMANHQNGRDTHVRGMKVFAPQQDAMQPLNQDIGFSTVQFLQYASVR
jgi:hypothetical protein